MTTAPTIGEDDLGLNHRRLPLRRAPPSRSERQHAGQAGRDRQPDHARGATGASCAAMSGVSASIGATSPSGRLCAVSSGGAGCARERAGCEQKRAATSRALRQPPSSERQPFLGLLHESARHSAAAARRRSRRRGTRRAAGASVDARIRCADPLDILDADLRRAAPYDGLESRMSPARRRRRVDERLALEAFEIAAARIDPPGFAERRAQVLHDVPAAPVARAAAWSPRYSSLLSVLEIGAVQHQHQRSRPL